MTGTRARWLVAALCMIAMVGSACSGDDGDASSSTTTAANPDGSTSSTESTAPGGVDAGATDGSSEPGETDSAAVDVEPLPPVQVGEPADFGGGLIVTLTEVESIDLEARAPGEIAGPGVLVTIELRNETDGEVDLAGLAVNATYGDGTPATPNLSGSGNALAGLLDPGDAASGSYAFRVPDDQMGSIRVDIHHAGAVSYVIVDVDGAVT